MFDITCTATLRPELLERTLASHVKYLFKDKIKEARLIINIDFAGYDGRFSKIKAILNKIGDTVRKYEFAEVWPRYSSNPHFPTAFLWCMNEVKSDLFFHLEEDWEMVMPIDFNQMLWLFEKDKSLAHLRLSMFPSAEMDCKNWNKFLLWNGAYFEPYEEDKGLIGWCGHPSLNRTSFMKECLKWIDPKHNPEKQIKGRKEDHPINDLFMDHRFGSFHPQNSPPAVIDIGREWMVENGWQKAGNKAWFTNWEKSNGT